MRSRPNRVGVEKENQDLISHHVGAHGQEREESCIWVKHMWGIKEGEERVGGNDKGARR